jgi:hypothetical protein
VSKPGNVLPDPIIGPVELLKVKAHLVIPKEILVGEKHEPVPYV